jgi:hypothetical protein
VPQEPVVVLTPRHREPATDSTVVAAAVAGWEGRRCHCCWEGRLTWWGMPGEGATDAAQGGAAAFWIGRDAAAKVAIKPDPHTFPHGLASGEVRYCGRSPRHARGEERR